MKRLLLIIAIVACSTVFANTIAVTQMKTLPKKVESFANDLYAEVTTEKRLLQLFLDQGKAKYQLSKEESDLDEATSIQSRRTTGTDASETMSFLLHGCNGVFTDEKGLVYFWILSSPRVLSITSQNYEMTFIVLDKPRPEWIKGLEKEANKSVQGTPGSGTSAATEPAARRP